MGDCLGDLTNELELGTYITDFACAGPKSYSYRTTDGHESVKFKGVKVNFLNSQIINFDSVKELVMDFNKTVTLTPQTQFKRCKYGGIIYNTSLVKKLTCTFDKRQILPSLDTIPFGFVE